MRSWAEARDLGLYLAQVYIGTKLFGEFVASITWVRQFLKNQVPLQLFQAPQHAEMCVQCVGPSMIPTIQPSPGGNLCIVNKTAAYTGFSVGAIG